MDVQAPSPWADPPASVRFIAAPGAFRKLVVGGGLLELLTFGFYRFWLATAIRRHLWSHTEIDGDALEYTGRGRELLLGFLFAMAILLPVFFVYTLIGIALERTKALGSIPLYGFLFFLGQYAVYRARRYRLTRTVWRGIRFWMSGSGWAYARRALGWTVLTWLTLGTCYPWAKAALERYKMRHTFYGTLPGRFDGSGRVLFKRVWWIFGLGILALIVAAAAIAISVTSKSPGPAVFGGVAFCAAIPTLHAMRRAAELRWWLDGIRFGGASVIRADCAAVTCGLRRTALIGVYWRLTGECLLAVLVFGMTGTGLVALYLGPLTTAAVATAGRHVSPLAFAAVALWYVLLAITLGILIRLRTVRDVWGRVANACQLLNPRAAADVGAAGEPSSALGEGLADGLDFAGF